MVLGGQVETNEKVISQLEATFKTGEFQPVEKLSGLHSISGRGSPTRPNLRRRDGAIRNSIRFEDGGDDGLDVSSFCKIT